MTKKHLFTVITLGLIIGMTVFVGCKPNGHGRRHAFALDYISETLDLTDAQASTLAEIQKEVEAKVDVLHKGKQAMHATLKEQLAADRMDETVIRSLIAQHREKMTQMIDLFVDRLIAFHGELTPDQKAKLIKKIEKFESWHDLKS